ncbi:MAG: FAD-binding oxidoreductase [Polyangiaceae bacterium]|jgi:ferredoxin-NADP reductase
MAANPKTLRIVASREVGPATRALDVEWVGGERLADLGGRYVIVHTGLSVGDKAIKRAYSLLPVGDGPHRARLTIKRIEGGPGSSALHAAPVGTELTFSGPWGKLVPAGGLAPCTVLLATDTGITSALGIVAQAVAAGSQRPSSVLWLHDPDEDFLSIDMVRERVEGAGVHFANAAIPPVRSKERVAPALAHIDRRVSETPPAAVIATGDGAIVHPLIDRLAGIDVRIECYFHNPDKKSMS